jgi:hypothetical protein
VSEPLFMLNKFAVSDHAATDEVSTFAQLSLILSKHR